MNNPYPASLKQKALIAYLGHVSPETATYKEAKEFIDVAIENESYRDLLDRWRHDKLKLHPDLYSEELESIKENRYLSIFNHCEDQRELFSIIDPTCWPLKKLNMKTCKKAVEWLDEGYAGWDLELFDSKIEINDKVIETYFVPAIANVAPDFMRKDRSGNPNPKPSQTFQTNRAESPPPIPVQEERVPKSKKKSYVPATKNKKRGCLFWLMVIILGWFGLSVLAAILK